MSSFGVIRDADTETPAKVNTEGQLHVVLAGKVDTSNSSSTPLVASDSFDGDAVEILDYAIIYVNVYSDVASAIDGLSIQQSSDGINWDNTDEFTIPAGKGKTFSVQAAMRYLRVVYTNGDSAQSSFRLQTVLKKTNAKPSSHRIQDSIEDDDDAELVKSVLSGKDSDGHFQNVRATKQGILFTMDFRMEVAKGNVPNHEPLAKFGRTDNLDSGTTPVNDTMVWDGANPDDDLPLWEPPTQARTHDIASSDAADSGTLVSSGNATAGSGLTTLVDTSATFQTDGVAIGDIVLNDTSNTYGIVESIDSQTQITVDYMANGSKLAIEEGDAYRVATAAGTGASVIEIKKCLDGNRQRKSEFVILNGTTDVPTSVSYLRIFRMKAIHWGSEKKNAGKISATAQVDLTITAQINELNNQTLMAIFTTAEDQRALITSYWWSLNRANPSNASFDVNLLVKPRCYSLNSGWQIKHFKGSFIENPNPVPHEFDPPFEIDPDTDIALMGINSSDNNVDVSGGFDGVLETLV